MKVRDINRISPFCEKLAEVWAKNFPDLRFGQLMSNFFGWLYAEKGKDMFYVEEKPMIEYFEEYCNALKIPKPRKK